MSDGGSQAASGTIVTFYSYKGGVGRSMALANVAALLSRWGRRVLIVDWDLEAPGIEKYFRHWLESPAGTTEGVVELIGRAGSDAALDWRSCRLTARIPRGQPVEIIPAGRDDKQYTDRLRALDWEEMFRSQRLGNYLETLRQEWRAAYDFVLVDSRTGVTDIGGICSIHLPDILVAMFVANEQSLMGMKRVLESAREGHAKLPVDRRRLLIVPVPSRDESGSEFNLAEEWRERFARELEDFMADWIPRDEKERRVMDYLKIPYFPYWSFGERIPVLEQEDPDNPKTLAYAYQPLARLLLSGMDWKEARAGGQSSEEAQKQAAQTEIARLDAVKIAEMAKLQAAERQARELQQKTREIEERTAKYIQDLHDQVRWWSGRGRIYIRRNLAFVVMAMSGAVVAATGLSLLQFGTGLGFADTSAYRTSVIAVSYTGAVLSAVGIGLKSVLKYSTKGRTALTVAAALTSEVRLFDSKAPPYADLPLEVAFQRFAQTVEDNLQQARRALDTNYPFDWMRRADAPASPTAPASEPGAPVAAPPPAGMIVMTPGSVTVVAEPSSNDVDVYVSYRPSAVLAEWLRSFHDLFSSWLSEELGREVVISLQQTPQAGPDTARCLLAVWTPSYFQSEVCLREWRAFVEGGRPVMPLLFTGDSSAVPPELRQYQYVDMSRFAYTGEAFRNTDLYIDYQKAVRKLAADVAVQLRRAGAGRSAASAPRA